MINVACLYPQHFAKVLAGRKQTERRDRKRADARLEAIRPGELLTLLESRTQRAITATVIHVRKFRLSDGRTRYAIRFRHPRLYSSTLAHRQGWVRQSMS